MSSLETKEWTALDRAARKAVQTYAADKGIRRKRRAMLAKVYGAALWLLSHPDDHAAFVAEHVPPNSPGRPPETPFQPIVKAYLATCETDERISVYAQGMAHCAANDLVFETVRNLDTLAKEWRRPHETSVQTASEPKSTYRLYDGRQFITTLSLTASDVASLTRKYGDVSMPQAA